MAIDVSREKMGDTSAGKCRPESGRILLDSAWRGELNCIGHEVPVSL